MRKTLYQFAIISLLVGSSVSCNEEQKGKLPLISEEIEISGLSDTQWTYFSFETGKVIGTSSFMSEKEDLIWQERKDWDIAICGKYLRTNSGTSGKGKGGVYQDKTSNFLLLENAPSDGYIIDKVQIAR